MMKKCSIILSKEAKEGLLMLFAVFVLMILFGLILLTYMIDPLMSYILVDMEGSTKLKAKSYDNRIALEKSRADIEIAKDNAVIKIINARADAEVRDILGNSSCVGINCDSKYYDWYR